MTRDQLAQLPRGAQILVPRGAAWGERVAEEIRERGASPRIVPLTEIAPAADPGALARAAQAWKRGEYDALVVTSANGAAAFVEAAAATKLPAETSTSGAHVAAGADGAADTGAVADVSSAPRTVAAVGPATARALQNGGYRVHVLPARIFTADGLAASLLSALPEASRVLLPVSEIADTRLERALMAAGHQVTRVTAYRTLPVRPVAATVAEITDGAFAAILVTSGSAARALAAAVNPATTAEPAAATARPSARRAIPHHTIIAALGGPTRDALAAVGLRADVVATEHTIPGLLDALAPALAGTQTQPQTPTEGTRE